MSQNIQYKRGETACGQGGCRSKLFFVEDGLTYCKRGHQQDVATQTQLEEGERGRQGRTTRKRTESTERGSRIVRGASAKELFLQAYQFILWNQCDAFIHTIGLPSELESVVKDLWALRLQLLKDKTDAMSDEETIFSSQPATSESEGEENKRIHRNILDKTMPSLIESLGLCYLAYMLLRLPIGIGDLHRWAVREDVIFIRAIRFVPAIIKQKLPPEYSMALDTTSTLEPDQIRKAIHNLGIFYEHHFGIVLPPLNAPLLLFKHIRGLALPISLFPVVMNMATLLSIDFSFPKPGRRQQVSLLPEVSLICLLVIAVKLYHPFDDLPRFVYSLNDPAMLTINWSKWTEAHMAHASRVHPEEHLVRGSEMHISEADAMKMSGEQLDDYLDWYERTWIDEDRARHKTKPLDEDFRRWFPTGRQDGTAPVAYDHAEQARQERQSAVQLSRDVIGALQLREVVTEEDERDAPNAARRIGSHYKRYRTLTDLTPHARVFYEASANTVGMKMETLLLAVLQIEQRLINWRKRQLKGETERTLDEGMESDELPVEDSSSTTSLSTSRTDSAQEMGDR